MYYVSLLYVIFNREILQIFVTCKRNVLYQYLLFTEAATFNISTGRWLATFNCEIPLVYISATCAAVHAWLLSEWFSLWRATARTSIIVVAHGKMHVIRVTLPAFLLHYHQCQLNRTPLIAHPFIAAINFNYLSGQQNIFTKPL